MHPLDLEIVANLVHDALFDRAEVAAELLEVVLVELVADHRQRQRRPVQRELHLFEEVRHRPDVVFVGVGNDDTDDLVFDLTHIRKIRYEDINAVHLLVREAHPDVDQDRFFIRLHDHHVPADLAQTAQRCDADFCFDFRVDLHMRVDAYFLCLFIFTGDLKQRLFRRCRSVPAAVATASGASAAAFAAVSAASASAAAIIAAAVLVLFFALFFRFAFLRLLTAAAAVAV
jgi:hypothetical protein